MFGELRRMAKGTDSEEFVMMSSFESRSGLKRELAFVLKVQSELPSSLGGIRARNFEDCSTSSNGVLGYSRKKKVKRSNTNYELKSDDVVEKTAIKEEFLNDSVNSQCEDERNSNLAKDAASNSGSKEEPHNDLVKPMSAEGLESNLVNVLSGVECQNDSMNSSRVEESKSNLAKTMSKEVPLRRFTRSTLKSKAVPLLMDDKRTKGGENVDEKSPTEEEFGVETSIGIDDTTGAHNASIREQVRRYTRSTLKLKAEETVIDGTSKIQNSLMDKPKMHSELEPKVTLMLGDNREAQNATLRQCNHSASELQPDVNGKSELENAPPSKDPKNNDFRSSREEGTKMETPIVIDDSAELQNASMEKPRRRFTRSALKCAVQPVIIDGTRKVQTALLEKPMRRLTRSASEHKVERMVIDGDGGLQNTLPNNSPRNFTGTALQPKAEDMVIDDKRESHYAISAKPLRRFTRSALEPKADDMVIDNKRESHNAIRNPSELRNALLYKPQKRITRSASRIKDEPMGMLATSTSCDNRTVYEDAHKEANANSHRGTDGISPLRTPRNKKLEMKMSKKIALTKFPSKVNELLETGMLEGLSVTYKYRGQQNVILRGTIKDCGVLCSCTLCNGCKVVTPMQFERHAGSANRNPAYYLYLDNGNRLRDVLNACKDVPLNMLKAAIQIAISSSPVKNAVCLNCKRPLPVSWTRRMAVLCNSCLESKKPRASPECTASTVTGSKRIVTPKSLNNALKCISPRNKSSQGKLTRKDLHLHKLVFEENGLPNGTELAYYVRGKKLVEGYKKGFGIFCFCCNSEISPSQFEAHAGCAQRRKPYMHIYTSNGVSLHELSISLSKGRKFSANDNDDLCSLCADFGDLLLCDACPRAFHKDCVGQSSIPRGKWYCPYCQNMFMKEHSCAYNDNAKAAGRVSGVDPIAQISKRCIRIVKTPETEVGGCTLCRRPGFSKSGFGPHTVILCDQCEKEFHVGCLRDHKMGDLKELPKGKWFCSADCSRIRSTLQNCVIRGSEKLPDSITNLIKKKGEETISDLDIRWRLLSGKIASPEGRSLLSKAVAIFHNRFDPIVDSVTGRDLIPCMVYGRNIRDQEFGGMFCAVLTVNSSVVSAGLLRIFGQELAELPLVATSSDYQGQGYFQSLFSCIERLLGFLNVKNLVLPAAEEAEAIWTDKFGFQKMSDDQVTKYSKECQVTIFKGTSMLHKPVPKCRIISKPFQDS